jgi:dipeptidyl aminopeptidase/acylaminoacyl peptidase
LDLLEGERLVSWYVEHNIAWANEHELLTATALNHYAEDPDFGPRIVSLNQTAALTLPSDGQTVLNGNVVQEWAAAPQPDRFAYRLREVTPDGSPLAESVQVADFRNGQLHVAATGPAGCDWLLWSPDGEWVAYRDLGQYCWDQTQISLLNARDGRLERHSLLQTSVERVSWVGWLRLPQD